MKLYRFWLKDCEQNNNLDSRTIQRIELFKNPLEHQYFIHREYYKPFEAFKDLIEFEIFDPDFEFKAKLEAKRKQDEIDKQRDLEKVEKDKLYFGKEYDRYAEIGRQVNEQERLDRIEKREIDEEFSKSDYSKEFIKIKRLSKKELVDRIIDQNNNINDFKDYQLNKKSKEELVGLIVELENVRKVK